METSLLMSNNYYKSQNGPFLLNILFCLLMHAFLQNKSFFLHLKRDIGINIMIESAQMYAHICLQSVLTSKSTGLPD